LKSLLMLKLFDDLDTSTDSISRCTKNTVTAPDSESPTTVMATATAGEKGATENEAKEEEKVVSMSVVSKEQAMQLLKPGPHKEATGTRKRSGSKNKGATATRKAGNGSSEDSSLEGKFVDLVDLLLPVPSKGEFDVNKIKSSLYFFS
jgi:DNA-directed RNA polymerase